MKDKIKDAVARGEEARKARLEAEHAAALEKQRVEREERVAWIAKCKIVAERWVESSLLAEIEAAVARGECSLDLDRIAYRANSGIGSVDALVEACREAGAQVKITSHENFDYETGNPTGRYYDSHQLVW